MQFAWTVEKQSQITLGLFLFFKPNFFHFLFGKVILFVVMFLWIQTLILCLVEVLLYKLKKENENTSLKHDGSLWGLSMKRFFFTRVYFIFLTFIYDLPLFEADSRGISVGFTFCMNQTTVNRVVVMTTAEAVVTEIFIENLRIEMTEYFECHIANESELLNIGLPNK